MRRSRTSTPADFFSPQVLANRRFYLDLGRSRTGPLAAVAGGFETCSPDYVVDRRAFPFFAIEFVAAGEGEVQLAGSRHALQTGSVFAYGPSVPHRITSSAAALEKYFVTFRGAAARRVLEQAGVPPGACRRVNRPAELRQVWEEVLHLGARTGAGATGRVTVGLRFLLAVIGDRRCDSPAHSRARRTLERAERFLQQHFLTVHRLPQVAEACHVNLPYLCRLSRRFRGHTLYEHLQRLKMTWAAERLQGPRLVREVADELGLDPFQFSRTFKRVHGLAPSEFQRVYAGRRASDVAG